MQPKVDENVNMNVDQQVNFNQTNLPNSLGTNSVESEGLMIMEDDASHCLTHGMVFRISGRAVEPQSMTPVLGLSFCIYM